MKKLLFLLSSLFFLFIFSLTSPSPAFAQIFDDFSCGAPFSTQDFYLDAKQENLVIDVNFKQAPAVTSALDPTHTYSLQYLDGEQLVEVWDEAGSVNNNTLTFTTPLSQISQSPSFYNNGWNFGVSFRIIDVTAGEHCNFDVHLNPDLTNAIEDVINQPPDTPSDPLQNADKITECYPTAIGCVPTNPGPLVNYILTRAISLGGGIAFLIMLFGAFTLITSAGNPENIKKGQELITSALAGLLLILGSVFLLKLIGIDILQIF